MMNAELTTELIVPTYNRLSILQDTLRQVRAIYPDLNICLGLQGEMPGGEVLAQWESDPHLRMERLPSPGTTAALNDCIMTSQADIALIMDDDAVPHFGCFESHLAAFAGDPALAYTAGREVRSSKVRSSFSEWIRIMVEWFFGMFLGKENTLNGRIVGWTTSLGFIFGNFDRPGVCRINSPRGCNMAVRREPFTKIGGFNEDFRGNAWGFEAEFGLRMAKRNKYGQYRGDAIVIHHEVPSGGSRAAQHSQWFSDFLYNHKFLIQHLGPQAWFGSVPRLLKKRFFNQG